MSNPVQYIILPTDSKMSAGKLAAQAAHAAVEGVRISAKQPWGNPYDERLVNLWMRGGHYAKVVLETDNLLTAKTYIEIRGFKVAYIIDEGRTEVSPLTPTAIGTEIVDKDVPHVRETFSVFKLFGTAADEELKRRFAEVQEVQKMLREAEEKAKQRKAARPKSRWVKYFS